MTMPFKRRVSKERDTPITPQMVAVFDQMRRARGERRRQLHGELFDLYMAALSPHPRPWEWPLCIDPREDVNPYPPGTAAHLSWEPNLGAQEMWKLDQASCEARAARNGSGSTKHPPAA
jgi:hypothetical protein